MSAGHLDMLRRMKTRKPFVPFRIATIKGDRFLVTDRYQFAVGQTRMLCYLLPELRRFVELESVQISGIEQMEESN